MLDDDDTDLERAAAARLAMHAFRHEVECYGVADGWMRKPADPAYAGWPEYLEGHAVGLTLPAEAAPRDEG